MYQSLSEFYENLDRIAAENNSDNTPQYQPSAEAVQQAKKAKTQYKPNSTEKCNGCNVLTFPQAKKGEKKSYVAIVNYDDHQGEAHGYELPDGTGIAKLIVLGGILMVVIMNYFAKDAADNTKAQVWQLNPPDKDNTCKPCQSTNIRRVG